MAFEMISTSPFWRFPQIWEEEENLLPSTTTISGLSIYEDEKNIYVEAAVPGIDPKNVEVTYDKGILWVKAEKEEEEKGKKYYRKASSSYSYRVLVPGNLDPNKEPQADVKNGIMTVAFTKTAEAKPKKIQIKAKA